VGRALKKDPRLRYESWNQFSADLASLVHNITPQRSEALSEARKFEALRGLPFFRDFREVEIWETLRAASWRRVSDGRTVIHEGERGDSLYVLVEGTVEISRGGNVLANLVPGACFGELLYFEDEHTLRSTTVRAVGDVTVLEIRAVALTTASDACQVQFNRAFLRILLARLDDATRKLAGG
jgi:CRP-like cAMP-binding protein